MRRATWLVEVLREAELPIVTYNGWQTRGRDFTDLNAVVWHHDASPKGHSPGVPAYMLREMAAGRAGAQLWVDRIGRWHILASGVAYHAGRVRHGMPTNQTSLGVETDMTSGEDWPPALISSLRRGTAAILRRLGTDQDALHFHKTICDPPGRKVDPWALELPHERMKVRELLRDGSFLRAAGAVAPQPIPDPLEDDVARLIKSPDQGAVYGTDGTSRWHVPKPSILADLVRAGIYGDGTVHVVGQETVDALPLVEVR